MKTRRQRYNEANAKRQKQRRLERYAESRFRCLLEMSRRPDRVVRPAFNDFLPADSLAVKA